MGFYLLDHKNPHHTTADPHWYTSRRHPIKAVVVHCTAGLEDQNMVGKDNSAEATAQYAATTTRQVSWHGGSDSDTHLYLLPPSYTAFHCINYNGSTYGWEISKRDMTWADEPERWVTATLGHAAAGLRPIAASLSMPLRHATRAELDHAIASNGRPVGFIGHRELDPERRDDPGRDFPWARFLNMLTTEEDDMPYSESELERIVVEAISSPAGRNAIRVAVQDELRTELHVSAREGWAYRNEAIEVGARGDMHKVLQEIHTATVTPEQPPGK